MLRSIAQLSSFASSRIPLQKQLGTEFTLIAQAASYASGWRCVCGVLIACVFNKRGVPRTAAVPKAEFTGHGAGP